MNLDLSATFFREAQIERAAIDPEKRTVELSFSSEAPVERFFGFEILDHGPQSVDLSRLNTGGPLLLDHNTRDQIGVIESARIENRRGKATVRLGKSSRASEIFQDIKDGIRRLVSVGYRVNTMITEKVEQGVETMRATSWTPMEISLVSVPADTSVGVGRSRSKLMTQSIEETSPSPREREILAIGERLASRIPGIEDRAHRACLEGTSIEDFRKLALSQMPAIQPISPARPLDVPAHDWVHYSPRRALDRMAAGRSLEGMEAELDRECQKRLGRAGNGILIPDEAWIGATMRLQRNFIAGTGTLGGMLVETSNLGDQFIELLRNRAQVLNLGARSINLPNPVTIPRQNAAGSTNWVGETVAATLSTGNFTQITLTPYAVSAFQQYSKQLLITDSPDIDRIIRDDIMAGIGLAIDLAALHGTGSGQPTGIANTTGIGTVTLAANGLALGNTTAYPAMVSLETAVATANADQGSLAYLARAGHRAAMKGQSRFANTDTPVWETTDAGQGRVNGYRAEVTQQIATNLTTGTATTITSAIFFGNWADLIIANFGGGVTDLVVDPYTLAVNAVVRVIARRWVDCALRHSASMAVCGGILTT